MSVVGQNWKNGADVIFKLWLPCPSYPSVLHSKIKYLGVPRTARFGEQGLEWHQCFGHQSFSREKRQKQFILSWSGSSQIVPVAVKISVWGKWVVNLGEQGSVGVFGTIWSYVTQTFLIKQILTNLFWLYSPFKWPLTLMKFQIQILISSPIFRVLPYSPCKFPTSFPKQVACDELSRRDSIKCDSVCKSVCWTCRNEEIFETSKSE